MVSKGASSPQSGSLCNPASLRPADPVSKLMVSPDSSHNGETALAWGWSPCAGTEPTLARHTLAPHHGLGYKLKFNFIRASEQSIPGSANNAGQGASTASPGCNSLGLPRSCSQTARAALSAQIYGAGSVWGLSYSCKFDRGLHYSASNPHALTAKEGPVVLPSWTLSSGWPDCGRG